MWLAITKRLTEITKEEASLRGDVKNYRVIERSPKRISKTPLEMLSETSDPKE